MSSSIVLPPQQDQQLLVQAEDCVVSNLDLTGLKLLEQQQRQAGTAVQAEAVVSTSLVEAASRSASAAAATPAEGHVSPEDEDAAEQCAQQFVDLYEHAFLSRAVQQLAEACENQGLSEAAVARKLRTRGIDLAQLQGRAAEVHRGIAECASDQGWKLIQVCHTEDNSLCDDSRTEDCLQAGAPCDHI